MRIQKVYLFYVLFSLIFFTSNGISSVSLTVYNQNMGVVKDTRDIEIKKGISKIEFSDVSAKIDPTSVHLKFLSDSDKCLILEQNFEYDLISRQKLLQKYIGQEIEIENRLGRDGEKKEILKGTLLSVMDGIVMQSDDKIFLNPAGEIMLSKLPEGLILKPTLSWLIDSSVSGKHKVEIDYITNSISWNADYIVVLGQNDKSLDLTGWVTIDNKSGASYKDANLKLIAGDVNRVQNKSDNVFFAEQSVMAKSAREPQFQEKSFFEYHIYTLGRHATIKDSEIKQIEFASASNILAKKLYIYDGAYQFKFYNYYQRSIIDRNYGLDSNKKIQVMIEFKNAKENNIGFPLPKGRIRVYSKDSDESLEFIGEDSIGHTPKDENIRIYLGDSFDITGERVQTDFKCGNNWCEETFKISLRNHKDQPVEIKVVERLYRWSNWKIIAKSDNFSKNDSKTIEFLVKILPNGNKDLTYTVKYSW